jgi:hypothetical protein
VALKFVPKRGEDNLDPRNTESLTITPCIYHKGFAKVRSASFHLHKRLLKSFGSSVEIWYDFPNLAILVSLGCWQLDGFQRRAPL